MSGEECFSILEKIFLPKRKEKIEKIKGYTIKYGNIVNNKEIIDEVLVSYFKAPKSYTTENMCEINSHGGMIVLKKILNLCLENGAEMANPGEFTQRAFVNGRIDLLQAESVIDIIDAKSEKELSAGIRQLEGFLSREIKRIKQDILDLLVDIEVSIDYPEYDVEEVSREKVEKTIGRVKKELIKLEKSFDEGKLIKNGIKVAIIGKPNAGKSSLLNALLKEERAIVTDIEGTTRDTIEEFVNICGIPLKLIDTAGIRETDDKVEKIGVLKTKEIANSADLIIAIFDSSKELSNEDIEILNMIKEKKSLIILNKTDLLTKINETDKLFSNKEIIKISAIKNIGIEEIGKKIEKMFNLNEIELGNDTVITNLRHKNLINKSIKNASKTIESTKEKLPIDIISINIREIISNLNEIIGEEVSENIINEIFSKFCLGK